ncbi:serine hydrolase [Streptomyces sp. AJS327]|uniref:serine hydrolase domain-containing protein n=1 Tax=Streptomyces sp. AJS327 TaxID=2545265 RepID=UPI0015E04BF6|nr:serine hydrolase domain-containing protein [Streptomyces sp. AJS327]
MAYARLRRAAPERAGLGGRELAALRDEVDALPGGGWCAGVTVLAGRGPYVVLEHAAGWALRYSGYDAESRTGVELPLARRLPAHQDTVFDLASLTKLFTALAALQQVERGRLDLTAEIVRYAPRGVPDHGITVRQLLDHTSGLRPELPLYDHPEERRVPLLWEEAPVNPPGSGRCYSDLNLLLLQRVLEQVSGRPLDALLHEGVTGPLGMTDTRFRPPADWRPRIAATEDQRTPWAKVDRGLVHGRVHDENCWALGGVAGHAGLFSTTRDLAVLCRTLLTGGAYGAARILAPSSVALLLDPPGLGFTTDQPYFMGELAGPLSGGRTAGHTGFTGTSLLLDPVTDTFLVLLANTVHPVRRPPDSGPRAAAATHLARAVRG